MNKIAILITALLIASNITRAEESIQIEIFTLTQDGTGPSIGTVVAQNTSNGTEFTPNLTGLSPGFHGFHIHQIPNCGPGEKNGKLVPGLAAGGHFDPERTGVHEGPDGKGHLGDLPALKADKQGNVTQPVLAPIVKVSDLRGRALIIHEGGDNYSDVPKKLGGGGARVACGVIE